MAGTVGGVAAAAVILDLDITFYSLYPLDTARVGHLVATHRGALVLLVVRGTIISFPGVAAGLAIDSFGHPDGRGRTARWF
jgi:hypothetical protein